MKRGEKTYVPVVAACFMLWRDTAGSRLSAKSRPCRCWNRRTRWLLQTQDELLCMSIRNSNLEELFQPWRIFYLHSLLQPWGTLSILENIFLPLALLIDLTTMAGLLWLVMLSVVCVCWLCLLFLLALAVLHSIPLPCRWPSSSFLVPRLCVLKQTNKLAATKQGELLGISNTNVSVTLFISGHNGRTLALLFILVLDHNQEPQLFYSTSDLSCVDTDSSCPYPHLYYTVYTFLPLTPPPPPPPLPPPPTPPPPPPTSHYWRVTSATTGEAYYWRGSLLEQCSKLFLLLLLLLYISFSSSPHAGSVDIIMPCGCSFMEWHVPVRTSSPPPSLVFFHYISSCLFLIKCKK